MTGPAPTVFLGSGQFGVPVADVLAAHPAANLVAVVTAPPRPAGRRGALTTTPVDRWAAERGVPTLRPPRLRDADAVDALRVLRPELLVLADYGQIVPVGLLEVPAHGALNLHPSLLPRHRGAAPIPATILAGDEHAGVTLMLMDAGLDTGPLIAQRRRPLRGDETAPELEEALARQAADLLAESLEGWLAAELPARPQPAEGATLTRPLRREDGRLDPAQPVALLERQVRAYQPWPGSYIELQGDRLIVWRAQPAEAPAPSTVAPGMLVANADGTPALVGADGLLELLEVQPAGRRRMGGADWLRGRPLGRLTLG